MQVVRGGLVAVTAAVLTGTLAFLYVQTAGSELGRQAEITSLLRRLREIDGHWDSEVLRRERGVRRLVPALGRPPAEVARVEHALASEVRASDDAGLSEEFAPVAGAFAEKKTLMTRYQAASAATQDTLREALAAVRSSAIDPATAARFEASLLACDTSPADNTSRLEADIAALEQHASKLTATTRKSLEELTATLRTFLAQRREEAETAHDLAITTAGARLDAFASSAEQRFAKAVQRRELYRIYLLYYTGALLVLLAYLGLRLSHSYRTIRHMNQALRHANDTLEQRVAERTGELNSALASLQESEAQLVHSAKMSSLGQMVAGVAHEINTPLAYVKNSLGAVTDRLPEVAAALDDASALVRMLEQDTDCEDVLDQQFSRTVSRLSRLHDGGAIEDLRALARDGLHGIDQIAGLVGNLRSFSRLDRSQVASYDVNAGLESSLALARHLLAAVEVRRELADVPSIRCSPSQVNQIFLNLITNAAQAMGHQGACLTLRSRVEGAASVAVDVADNGSGIAPEVLPRIFDPFFTTKEIGKGTGLGLSIAYKIAQQHGGRIDVTSTPGVGTCFTLVLPIALPAATELAA
ncbi:MAG: hypothetical protein JNK68_07925 [Betaproteobacteria bacterium]|nr:hypothetical protein [Betaproteobacteria bacterium]